MSVARTLLVGVASLAFGALAIIQSKKNNAAKNSDQAQSLHIRQAAMSDVPALIKGEDPNRSDFIRSAVTNGQCFVAVAETKASLAPSSINDGFGGSSIVGYSILNYHFFECGFIDLLVVAPSWRRRGIGRLLLKHIETVCRTPKLFTSTNQSNQPMQALLTSTDYKWSGIVHNLDMDDPELFYYKPLPAESR